MAKVKFTAALTRFFPGLRELEVEGNTVQEVLKRVNAEVPGVTNYLLEEDGSLRKHVNIFVKDELIKDRNTLSDEVHSQDEMFIYQALSGG
jgi:molybdopterin converting factor small subunit